MRWIELTTVSDQYQAFFLKRTLEGENVQCIILNEATNQWIGSLIQVRVAETDQIKAVNVYEELKAKMNTVICPNCESQDVKFGLRKKTSWIQGLLLLALTYSLPIVAPFDAIYLYHCKKCSTEFRKEKF